MKRLYESILGSTDTGKYREGVHIIEDDIPCTVIGSDNKYIYLLSDSMGYRWGKTTYISDNDMDSGNDHYYTWGNEGCEDFRIPKEWDYPDMQFISKFKKILLKHFAEHNKGGVQSTYIVYTFLVKSGRDLEAYDSMFNELRPNSECGIRFIKKIEK